MAEAADHASSALAVGSDAFDGAAAEQPAASGKEPRHVGHQHRLLGVGGAAEGAVVGAAAVLLAAQRRDPLVAERVGAALHEPRVLADRLRILWPHAHSLF